MKLYAGCTQGTEVAPQVDGEPSRAADSSQAPPRRTSVRASIFEKNCNGQRSKHNLLLGVTGWLYWEQHQKLSAEPAGG